MSPKEALKEVKEQATDNGYHRQAAIIQDGINEIIRLEDELAKIQLDQKPKRASKAS